MLRISALLILAAAVAITAARGAENAPAASTNRAPKLSDLFGDDVLARGKGVEVKRSHLEEAFVAFKNGETWWPDASFEALHIAPATGRRGNLPRVPAPPAAP